MPLLPLVVLALTGSPSPSPSVKEPDPDTVSPGWWGFISLVFLIVTVYLIWRGLTKQLKRVDFDENAPQTIARGPRDPAATSTPADATSESGSTEGDAPGGETAASGAPESGRQGHGSPTEADGDEPARSE